MNLAHSTSRYRIGSILPKIAYAWSALGLVLASVSFLFPKVPAGLLCFYFFFSWLWWLSCVFLLRIRRKVLLLVGLWVLTDISILVTFLSVITSLGDVGNSRGSEMIWAIAYMPTIMPIGPVLANWLDQIGGLTQLLDPVKTFLLSSFGAMYGQEIFDWIGFSFISAMQCVIVAGVVWSVQEIWQESMIRSIRRHGS